VQTSNESNTMKRFLCIIAAGLCLQHVYSAETITIFSDEDKSIGEKSGDAIVGPLRFAALDIDKAINVYDKANAYDVVHQPLSALTAGFTGKKIVIALSGNTVVKGMLATQGGAALPALETQAYNMQTTGGGTSHWVFGGDDRGAMYGGLQLAEELQFEAFTTVQPNTTVSPHVMSRGSKINVAFDYRIPTYDGRNDTATPSIARGIEQVWKIDFWKSWLDEQARNRINLLSVWTYNPFPVLVNVPGYENSTIPWIVGMGDQFDDNGKTDGFKSETVPGVAPWQDTTLTKDVRLKFWREVMLYAKKRGFDFYFFNWNINLSWVDNFYPVSSSHDKPANFNNVNDRLYTQAAIKELFKQYPDLTGFGVSGGDQVPQGSSSADISKWMFGTYGPAIKQICTENPTRKIGFIHRGLKVDAHDVIAQWKTTIDTTPNLKFDYSMKYCKAYTYATENPEWTFKEMVDLATTGLSTFLTLRNDGFYYPDFGDSEFVRNFIKNLPSRKYRADELKIFPKDKVTWNGEVITVDPKFIGRERLSGFYFGHDTYTPTISTLYKEDPKELDPRKKLNNDPETGKPMYEFQRKWLSEMLWGRIAYDVNVGDEVFARGIEKRFPTLPKDKYSILFSAWAKSTAIHTKLTELVIDQWHFDSFFHTEFCMFKDGGEDIFRTLKQFYLPYSEVFKQDDPVRYPLLVNGNNWKDEPRPAEGSKHLMASVRETALGQANGRRTSYDVADTLFTNGDQALKLMAQIPPQSDIRFNALMKSLRAQACLGLYYSYKVRAATLMGETVLFPGITPAKITENKAKAKDAMYAAWGWWSHYINTMEDLYVAEDFRTYGLKSLKVPLFIDGKRVYKNGPNQTFTPQKELWLVEANKGWRHWDEAVKKEYTDLGGTAALVLPVIPEFGGATKPIITSLTTANATVGVAFTYTITASGSPILLYEALNLPAGLTLNTSTGVISGRPTIAGTFTMNVSATNGAGKGTAAAVTITVAPATTTNTAPTISSIPPASTNEDVTFGPVNFTVGDAQTAAGLLTVSAASSNTALVPVSGIAFGGTGANRTITVTPLANQNGSATISVTVSDGTLTAVTSYVLTVRPVNDAPQINVNVPIADKTALVNVPFNFQVPATAVTDIDSPTLTWSAAGLPTTITFNPATRTFSGTPTAKGEILVTVTVSDGALSVSDVFKITVGDQPTLTDIKINFQPETAPAFPGYSIDSGKIYGPRANGQTYGWSYDMSSATRDRNSALSINQLYDTFILTQLSLTKQPKWEIQIPNGQYSVRIIAGDPGRFYADMNYVFKVEGSVVLNNKPTSVNRWVEDTETVTVNDGRLTLENDASAVRNRINVIEIKTIPANSN
jgi:Putative Ig domain